MLKKIKLLNLLILTLLSLAIVSCKHPEEPETPGVEELTFPVKPISFDQSSIDAAKSLVIGWNLGNTMDATSDNNGKNNAGIGVEAGWIHVYTEEAMIQEVAKAGFRTLRLPTSWHNHITDENYTIDAAWMARVKEIVDWAIKANMNVILNVHHDNMEAAASSNVYGYFVSRDEDLQIESKAYLTAVWTQIATEFKNYGANLVFEVLNEPRTAGEKTEWWIGPGNYDLQDIVTSYEQVCVDAIRATGGNNEKRFIMTPCYGASADTSIIKQYKMPKDTAKDKLILSSHPYSPYFFAFFDAQDRHEEFTSNDEYQLDVLFGFYESNYIDKGIGVVFGETGATNKANLEERVKWAKYFFSEAYKRNIPAVLWDNMRSDASLSDGDRYGYFDRNNCVWFEPELIKAMMDAVGVKGYQISK